MSTPVSDFDYACPPDAVAQVPTARRDGARLLCVPRAGSAGSAFSALPERSLAASGAAAAFQDRRISDLPELLRPGDLLVLNEARVLPARLLARRVRTGGRVSVLVLAPQGRAASVLLGTRGTLQAGERLSVAGDTWRVAQSLGEGRFLIEVEQGRDVRALLGDVGRMPLPPYIERDAESDARDALDRERYQTVFASGAPAPGAGRASPDGASADGAAPAGTMPGAAAAAVPSAGDGGGDAVAAPTAGLHFTPELLATLAARGVRIEKLRLQVGEGTFRPLRGATLDEHVMHEERYEVPASLAAAFAELRAEAGACATPGRADGSGGRGAAAAGAVTPAARGRVVAVGTTVVRALESAVADDGRTLRTGSATTRLFLRPGCRFRAVDVLLTNFHQPRSTLLVLVSAFAGTETIRTAYTHALARGYRFFSYGDAMLLA